MFQKSELKLRASIPVVNGKVQSLQVCSQSISFQYSFVMNITTNFCLHCHKSLSIMADISGRIRIYFNRQSQLLLQTIKFKESFFKPPMILATVLNGDSNNANIPCSHKSPLANWLEVQCLHILKSNSRQHFQGFDGQQDKQLINS